MNKNDGGGVVVSTEAVVSSASSTNSDSKMKLQQSQFNILIKNNCRHKIWALVYYLGTDNVWKFAASNVDTGTHLWFAITKNSIMQWYAKSYGSTEYWGGSYSAIYGGKTYGMIRENMGSTYINYYRTLTCASCSPVSCSWNNWSGWSTCTYSSAHGTGRQYRTRSKYRSASCGGADCSGSGVEWRSCAVCSPVNCLWNNWSGWSTCTYSSIYKTGRQYRTRSKYRSASCGGADCSGDSTQWQSCALCSPVNCLWNNWSGWSTCTYNSAYGTGRQYRTRSKYRSASCGGADCSGSGVEWRSCTVCQPVHCKWNAWPSTFSTCRYYSNLGGWYKWRKRTVQQQANSCGNKCAGSAYDIQKCSSCTPRNCQWGGWSLGSTCSWVAARNSYVQTNTRSVLVAANSCGASCKGADKDYVPCGRITINNHCSRGTVSVQFTRLLNGRTQTTTKSITHGNSYSFASHSLWYSYAATTNGWKWSASHYDASSRSPRSLTLTCPSSCSSISSCDRCIASSGCGWCASSNTCQSSRGSCSSFSTSSCPCVPKASNDVCNGVCGWQWNGCQWHWCGTACGSGKECTNRKCVAKTVCKTCASEGRECGMIYDGCGGRVTCGDCNQDEGLRCDWSTGKCVADKCVPSTSCARQGLRCGKLWDGCEEKRCGVCFPGFKCRFGKCMKSAESEDEKKKKKKQKTAEEIEADRKRLQEEAKVNKKRPDVGGARGKIKIRDMNKKKLPTNFNNRFRNDLSRGGKIGLIGTFVGGLAQLLGGGTSSGFNVQDASSDDDGEAIEVTFELYDEADIDDSLDANATLSGADAMVLLAAAVADPNSELYTSGDTEFLNRADPEYGIVFMPPEEVPEDDGNKRDWIMLAAIGAAFLVLVACCFACCRMCK
eukprot:TRINITY_DN67822_c9_g2_i3.p1 TRINITY_DN67822_c9_g2~~TRINITY_DN67822_c9_g2_i3.p1  ORF type:complete len:966 (-),score=420.49 TRINITY_DN67822_c9_g2_i3:65-2725(-)